MRTTSAAGEPGKNPACWPREERGERAAVATSDVGCDGCRTGYVAEGCTEPTTIAAAEGEFLGNLELLDDRLLQYEYLLAFIDDLCELPEGERCEELKVEGCASNAWMELRYEGGCLRLRLSADSLIIKGLLGVLCWLLDGRPLAEVAAWEPRLLEHPQLKPQLNVDRRRGMASIVREIQAFCAAGE